jgi:hypothetical protein
MVWKYFYKKGQDALARGTFEKPLTLLTMAMGIFTWPRNIDIN